MAPYKHHPSFRDKSGGTLAWKIAIGVFIGILAAGLVGYWVRMYFIQQALESFNRSIQQISVQSQRSAQELQRQQAMRQQQAINATNQKKLEIANAQRQAEAIHRHRIDEATRKEAAWVVYYKKPSHCDVAEGHAFVECANGHIRAKKRFEEMYTAGKIH